MSLENPAARSVYRRLLPWLGLLLLGAAIFDGVVFYTRWRSTHDLERANTAREAAEARKFLQMAGGSDLAILAFYAAPGTIRPGQAASLCYGVRNAATVRLDPPVEEVWPTMSRCIQVSPHKDTEYKLTAADAAGHAVSQSLVIRAGH